MCYLSTRIGQYVQKLAVKLKTLKNEKSLNFFLLLFIMQNLKWKHFLVRFSKAIMMGYKDFALFLVILVKKTFEVTKCL